MAASFKRVLAFPSSEKTGDTVQGFENYPDTLGIPDNDDGIQFKEDPNAFRSESESGKVTVKAG